jgi:predicted dehydrogenase
MPENNMVIRTGLLAYGMSGQVFHAPFLNCMPEFDFTGVVERHQKKARDLYPDVRSYDSVEALLADRDITLVVVNTPNTTHYDYVKKALEAGKHVVVEKPFTATVGQAESLVEIAAGAGRFLCVYQNRRWDSDFLTVKDVMDKGLLGKLIEAELHYDRYRIAINDKKKHKEVPDTGVGLLYDLGPHLVDEAIVLFGKPRAVFAIVQSHRPDSLVDDYFDIKLLYNKFTCTLKSSLLVREQLPGYVMHGTLGSFVKARADIQEAELQAGVSPCSPGWGEEPEASWGILHTEREGRVIREPYPSVVGDYREFFRGVHAALVSNDPPPVPLADSILNMRILEAAQQSSREMGAVEL